LKQKSSRRNTVLPICPSIKQVGALHQLHSGPSKTSSLGGSTWSISTPPPVRRYHVEGPLEPAIYPRPASENPRIQPGRPCRPVLRVILLDRHLAGGEAAG